MNNTEFFNFFLSDNNNCDTEFQKFQSAIHGIKYSNYDAN